MKLTHEHAVIERPVQIAHRFQLVLCATYRNTEFPDRGWVVRSALSTIFSQSTFRCGGLVPRDVRDTSGQHSNNQTHLIGAPIVTHSMPSRVESRSRRARVKGE